MFQRIEYSLGMAKLQVIVTDAMPAGFMGMFNCDGSEVVYRVSDGTTTPVACEKDDMNGDEYHA